SRSRRRQAAWAATPASSTWPATSTSGRTRATRPRRVQAARTTSAPSAAARSTTWSRTRASPTTPGNARGSTATSASAAARTRDLRGLAGGSRKEEVRREAEAHRAHRERYVRDDELLARGVHVRRRARALAPVEIAPLGHPARAEEREAPERDRAR